MSARRRLFVSLVACLLLGGALTGVVLSRDGRARPAARPGVAHDRPGPVLLVPGFGGGTASLERLAARLRAAGRTATVVPLPGDGTGDLTAQTVALDVAVARAIASGAASVDIVGFSAGGVVARLWAADHKGAA
ncbi:MAG: esterase/lipase family protein [Actinomycetes bacterium]